MYRAHYQDGSTRIVSEEEKRRIESAPHGDKVQFEPIR